MRKIGKVRGSLEEILEEILEEKIINEQAVATVQNYK